MTPLKTRVRLRSRPLLPFSPKELERQKRAFQEAKATRKKARHLAEDLKVRAGVVTIFDNAVVYGNPLDAMSYYVNKRGRKEKFGEFRGFIIGEIIDDPQRILFEYIRDNPKVIARRRHKANLRKHHIEVWRFDKYLKKNTLDKIFKKR